MIDLVASNGVLHLCIMNGVEEALAVLLVLHGTGWKECEDEDLHAMQRQVVSWYTPREQGAQLCFELRHGSKNYRIHGGGYSSTGGAFRGRKPTVYVTAEYWITQALHPNHF